MAKVNAPQPPPVKNVLMYRNGDKFFVGKKFVVCHRQVSTFETFLTQVSRNIDAPFGAVRNIYTPQWGHKINDLAGLQNGEKYVAAGAEKFKKMDYLGITTSKPQRRKSVEIRPVVHSKIVAPARWKKFVHEPYTINVFTNGDLLRPPVKILIPKYIEQDWERILSMVTEKVYLRTGAVQRLSTVDGHYLTGIAELENNQYYVAVGSEKFKKMPYLQWLSGKSPQDAQGVSDRRVALQLIDSQRNLFKSTEWRVCRLERLHYELLPPMRKGKRSKNDSFSNDGTSDSAPLPSPHQVMETHAHAMIQELKGCSPMLDTAPGKAKHYRKVSSTSPLPLPDNDGWNFKAPEIRKEVRGATEVEEDTNLKLDLPVDQLPAEIVTEEELPPHPQKNPAPVPHWKRKLQSHNELNDHDIQEAVKADIVQHITIHQKEGMSNNNDYSVNNANTLHPFETDSSLPLPSSLTSFVSEVQHQSGLDNVRTHSGIEKA
ncbi:doublecortin domain-containing protein 2C [Protopterus annectens]|uniref:doublecortin domain-containing protein 2C n=1 Tax=Protopterus annectens TaxID=7888 RepID=UPI001CFA7B5A|nr:doublecortin domain-containing protein 2C [Protopterus annectens]